MSLVIDASALLALLNQEPGVEQVLQQLDGASMSAVNWSEVVQKALHRGVDTVGMRAEVQQLGLRIEAFTPAHAESCAALWSTTRQHGLSLADRACLALAQQHSASVLTADRAWTRLGLDLKIQLLR